MVSSTHMTISQEKIVEYKEKLEAEKTLLEKELNSLGRAIDDKGDWIATPAEQPGPTGNDDPDKNVQADYVEDFEERVAELSVLEARYKNVLAALARMTEGSYGTCSVNGADIEPDRLDANPAASTCKEHMK